jgi:hypothetical protein
MSIEGMTADDLREFVRQELRASELGVVVQQLRAGVPQLVTVLPSAPYDGQVLDYVADATGGVVWRLRYRAASASSFKWEFVGGSALTAIVSAQTTVVSSSYPGSAQTPSVTVPLAGDYLVRRGFQGGLYGATNGGSAVGGIHNAGTLTGGELQAGTDTNIGADGTRFTGVFVEDVLPGLAASNVLDLRYRRADAGGGGGTAYFTNRWLAVTPVRVG